MSLSPFLHAFARPAAKADEFITIVRGEGAMVYDKAGKGYVDGLASLWYCNVGHGNTEIADAISAQSRKLGAFQTFDIFTNEPAEELATELVSLAPMPDARVFYTSGGSEAVDTAIKLARISHVQAGNPDKTVIISRSPSYHGVNYGGLAATGIAANQAGFGKMLPDFVQVPQNDLDAMGAACAMHAGKIAAIIAEPVLGAPGVFPPSPGYLNGLRALADQHGAYLILDEVICGFGRLGEWWGAQKYGVTPDLVCFAKGVTSGYQPLGGVLVGQAVRAPLEADSSFLLRHGYTYSGHPTAAAAGVANLKIIRRDGLLERANVLGARLGAGLEAVTSGRVAELRGAGAVWAITMNEGVSNVAVRNTMLEHGVIVRPIAPNHIAYCPPLVSTEAQIDQLISATDAALSAHT